LNDQLTSNSATTSPAALRPVERATSVCGSSAAAARPIAPAMAATSSQVKVPGPVSRFT